MLQDVFGEKYSRIYDLLYREKDYEAECDFLEAIFKKNGIQVKTILDLGCGTGGHMIPLARRGYQVTGVERSEHMLKSAEEAIAREKLECELIHGDLRGIDLGGRFDAVISMFAVMSYQTTNRDIASACRMARNHLDNDGLFVFDAWHGPAVLTHKPGQAFRTIETDKGQIIRLSEPKLDIKGHLVEVRYKFWLIEGDRIRSMGDESHLVRFFFPQEIAYFLEVAGFGKVRFCPFMKLDEEIERDAWNMTVIGKV